MTYHAEHPRYSHSSLNSTNGSPTTAATLSPMGHRGSIFDLMFLLRRSSGSRSKLQLHQKQVASKVGEGEAFLHQQPHETEEDDKEMSRDQLLAKIREKKEVIEKLRCQPWPMRRKRRTLKLAQKYLQKHESKVSKTHLYKEAIARKWKKFQRWCANISVYLIPWEMKIKAIESQFGTVVSSYFTFLRWILWMNISITVMMLTFIVIPEVLADKLTDRLEDANKTEIYSERKKLSVERQLTADRIQTVWDYSGYIAKSPLFYGYYSNEKFLLKEFNYPLPLIYFLVNLLVLGYSFFAILRKMAANARSNRMTSGKTEQYPFVWKITAGWDFSIGVAETATNAAMANVMKFREAINEYKEKQKEKFQLVLFLRRVLANIIILGMMAFSTWLITYVVLRSQRFETDINASSFQKNEVPIVVSVITLIFPNIFELLGILLERFHPRIALRLQLGRILVLYLLNFFTLIFALMHKLGQCSDPSKRMANGQCNTTDSENTGADSRRASALHGGHNGGWTNFENYTNDVATLYMNADNYSDVLNNLTTLLTPGAFINRTLIETTLLGGALPLTGPVSLFHLIKNYFQNNNTNINNISNSTKNGAKNNNTLILKRFRRQRSENSMYFEYTTEHFDPTTTTTSSGGLLATTFNEHYGTVGVGNAKAKFRANVSEDELVNGNITIFPVTPPPPATIKMNVSELLPIMPYIPIGGRLLDEFAPYMPAVDVNYADLHHPPGNGKGPDGNGKGHDGSVVPDRNQPEHRRDTVARYTDSDYQCWENIIGQEMCKLITMDLVMSIASILFVDFFRGLWVRYCSRWWCWSLETFFPEYGEFKVAENVLHLINNQGMIWLGLFFAPLLPAINNIKIIILLYVRAWALVTCNVPATQVFRASRSSNFYLLLCLLMLFLCTVPVGIVIAMQTPSKTCGPFANLDKFYSVISHHLPADVSSKLDTVASPGVVVPMLILLILIIYFLVSLVRGLKEANEELQSQLILERTEEKRKIYRMAGKKDHPERGSMALPETRKIDRSHLPGKEQIRREPWHPKLHLNDTSGTDSSRYDDDSVTPSLEGYSPASPSRHHGLPEINPSPYFPSHMGASPVGLFVPSLTCLPEENRSTNSSAGGISEEDDLDSPTKAKPEKDTVKVTIAPPKASMEDLTARTTTPATTNRTLTNNEAVPLHAGKDNNLNRNAAELSPTSGEQNGSSNILRPFPPSPFYDVNFLSPTTALTTPNSELSWPLSAYDNDSVIQNNTNVAARTPSPATPSISAGFDLSPGMLAEMLSPTKFSPNSFEAFLRQPFQRKNGKNGKNGNGAPAPARSKSPEVLVHISGTDTDHDKNHPSDSGRATMDNSSALPGTTETDTGTESELERFAKSRLKAFDYNNRNTVFAPIKVPVTTTEEEEDDEDVEDSRPLVPQPSTSSSSTRKFEPLPAKLPDTKTVIRPMYTSFVPWPSPGDAKPPSAGDSGRPSKPILKHVGPPGRGSSGKPPLATTDSQKQHQIGDSPAKRPKFKISVSPSRGGRASSSSSPDSGSRDRKPYIIRQTLSRTPSPVGSPPVASGGVPSVMSSSVTTIFPTKLSVIDEGLISKPVPAPRRRVGSSGLLTDSSLENLSNILPDLERLSRPLTRRNNNDDSNGNGHHQQQQQQQQQQSTRKPAHYKSKETMI